MDFLDPKRKKSHKHRLLIGYLLVAIAISLATWLLLNSSFGYWVDPKTGDIIQNGTVFIESQPSSSLITLNGHLQSNKTSTRLVLPGSQQYTVKLTNSGYRDWNRTFALTGGKIERLTYPLMVPRTLKTAESQLYATQPTLSSQSPDKRWLLVLQPGQFTTFDMYDLANLSAVPAVVTVPTNIMTDPTKTTDMKVVDWSGDSRHVLVDRSYNDTHEYLMIDTSNVASSININSTLTINPTTVTLRDSKAELIYIYDATGGTLRQGDLKNRTVSGAILSNIVAYKSWGADLVMYATRQGAVAGKLNYRIRESDKATYLLKSVPDTSTFLLDISEYDGVPYFVVGSQVDDAAFVYRDPLPVLKGQANSPLIVSSVLRLTDPRFISVSPSGQFISVQSGNKIVTYDVDGDRQYQISLNHNISKDSKLAWLDDYRYQYNDKDMGYMIDFDGSNDQALVPVYSASSMQIVPDKKTLVTIAPSLKATGRTALTTTSLIKK